MMARHGVSCCLSICTLNCMLLPLPGFQHRAAELVNWLLEHARGVDVLVLTEIFSSITAHGIVSQLRCVWPHIFRPLNTTVLMDGGVMIASRWPVSQCYAVRFTHGAHSDRLADKGAVAVVVHKRKQKPVVVVGVHMQAGFTPAALQARFVQWCQLRWFVQQFLRNVARHAPRFVAGDFNEDVRFSHALHTGGFAPILPPRADGVTFDLDFNAIASARANEEDATAMLDGVLVDTTSDHTHVATARVLFPRSHAKRPFTDHEALLAVIASRAVTPLSGTKRSAHVKH